jgi:hypothetical protein
LNFLRAAVREPLLHFVLIGALLFAVTALRQKQSEHAEIRITAGEVAQLAAFWETQAQRKPTAEELRGAIEERIDEEVLAREPVRLGLDRDDVIVRRRLAQKMAFVSDDLAVVAEPSEASCANTSTRIARLTPHPTCTRCVTCISILIATRRSTPTRNARCNA